MAKIREFIEDQPILVTVPPDTIAPGRISSIYRRDNEFKYKDSEGEQPLFRDRRYHNFSAALRNNSTNTSFLRRDNAETDRCPFVITYNCELFEVALTNRTNDDDDWNLRLYKNGAVEQDFLKPEGPTFTVFSNLNLPFVPGDLISLQCQRVGSGNISYPGCTLYFREIFL